MTLRSPPSSRSLTVTNTPTLLRWCASPHYLLALKVARAGQMSRRPLKETRWAQSVVSPCRVSLLLPKCRRQPPGSFTNCTALARFLLCSRGQDVPSPFILVHVSCVDKDAAGAASQIRGTDVPRCRSPHPRMGVWTGFG